MDRKSTAGRPRNTTDAQVAAILEWHRTHKTKKQLARELDLSISTVNYVIRINGEYKQCDPEQRAAQQALRAKRIAGLRARYLP